MASPGVVYQHSRYRIGEWRPDHQAQDKMRQYAQMRLNYEFIRQHGSTRLRDVCRQLSVDEYLELSHLADLFAVNGIAVAGNTASA